MTHSVARIMAGRVAALLAAMVCGGRALQAGADHPWQPIPSKVSLMVIAAHLDDEGIYFGGTMPYYAGVLGLPTVHIAMTSGDSSVPTVTREAESRECDWEYGLRNEPIFAHFKDWGMGNHAPYTRMQRNWSLWYEPDPGPAYYRPDGSVQTAASPFLYNDPPGEANPAEFDPGRWKVATYLARQIRTCKPDVIVTHDLSGEYGHSNHRTTSCGAWDAYYLAADPSVDIDGLPAWQAKKLYFHLFNRVLDPIAPDTPLPGTSYPAGTTIINRQYQDWSTPYPELNGKTPLQVANDGIVKYVSIGGTNLLTQFAVRYSEQYGLYASTVGPDTVDQDGWARTSFFENISPAETTVDTTSSTSLDTTSTTSTTTAETTTSTSSASTTTTSTTTAETTTVTPTSTTTSTTTTTVTPTTSSTSTTAPVTTADLSGAYGALNNHQPGYPDVNLPLTIANPGVNSLVAQPGFVGASYASYIASSTPVGWWGMNEPAGNLSVYLDGGSGSGAYNHSTNQYAGAFPGAIYRYESGFSVEVWAKVDGFVAADSARFIGVREWGFGYVGPNGPLHFTTFGKQDYFSSASIPSDGAWHQFGVSWDGNVTATFYIDGVAAGTHVGGTTGLTPINNASPNNRCNLGSRATDTQHFKGWVDEAVIWGTPRTAQDFAASYAAATQEPVTTTAETTTTADTTTSSTTTTTSSTTSTTTTTAPKTHSADYRTSPALQVPNWKIDTTELNRVLVIWRNLDGCHNDAGQPDRFAAGLGDRGGATHSADYRTSPALQVPNWKIDTTELNRVLVIWRNIGGYHPDPGQPDGYAAGAP